MTPLGDGGKRGISWGGMTVFDAGVVGEGGTTAVAEGTGPGGGGSGFGAVLLCVPGSTTVSESWILGLVLLSGCLESAKKRCW